MALALGSVGAAFSSLKFDMFFKCDFFFSFSFLFESSRTQGYDGTT